MTGAIENRVGGIRDNLISSGLHFIFSETSYSVKIEIRKALIPHKANSWQQQPIPQITQPPPNYLPPNTTLHVGPPGFSRIIQPPNNQPNKFVDNSFGHSAGGAFAPLGAGDGVSRLVANAEGGCNNINIANHPPPRCDQCKKLADLLQKSENLSSAASPRIKSLEKEKTFADEKIKTLESQISKAKNEVSKSQAEQKTSQAQIEQLGKANATLEFQVCETKKEIMRIQSEKIKSEANLQAQNAQLKGEITTRGNQLKEKNKNLSRCELESTQLMSELESTKNSMNKKVENLLAKNNSLNKKLDEAKEALKKVKNDEKKAKKKKSKNIQVQTQEPLYSNAGALCVCGRSSGGSPKTDGEPPVGNLNDNWDTIREVDKRGKNNTTEVTKDNPFEMFKFTKNVGGDKDNNSIESEVTQTVPPKSLSDPLTVPKFATMAIELKNLKSPLLHLVTYVIYSEISPKSSSDPPNVPDVAANTMDIPNANISIENGVEPPAKRLKLGKKLKRLKKKVKRFELQFETLEYYYYYGLQK